jgi:xylulokinase
VNFLGLDIGTSAVKAVLVDENQAIIATASRPIKTSRPQPHWAEQDPEEWWTRTCDAVSELLMKAGSTWRDTRAIGLSGQMHGAVLLDKTGKPLRPAIIWSDARAHQEAKELESLVPSIGHIAGVPPMASFVAPKLLWLNRHEPQVLANLSTLLMPKDYLQFRMTGQFATDMCDASGALLLDVAKRQWSPAITAACGVSSGILPKLFEGCQVVGPLRREVARTWGLSPETIVAAGAGDAAAGAIGIGAVQDGDAFISLGTASQYFVTRETCQPAPETLIHTFCHGLPNRWFQMAALLNGASCLAWIADVLGQKDIGALLAETEANYQGPSSVLFLPYLEGERTPHNNPHAKGVLFGLTPSAHRSDIVAAVLEGVALSLADCQDHLAKVGPHREEIGVTGGGARSPFWLRLIAGTLGRPLVTYVGGETGPAFGAARLARLAATGEPIAEVCTPPPVAKRILPDPNLVPSRLERLEKLRALYKQLKPLFAA